MRLFFLPAIVLALQAACSGSLIAPIPEVQQPVAADHAGMDLDDLANTPAEGGDPSEMPAPPEPSEGNGAGID